MNTWRADLADAEATDQLFTAIEPDIVFHLASHVSGSRSLDAVRSTLQNNLVTTVNVLTAACRAGRPRTVLAGSYEEVEAERPAEIAGSPYAVAKTASAAYGRMFSALYELPVVNLRTAMVYGPGQRDRSKLVPYVAEALLRGETPQLSGGTRQVDWIYIDDIVDAFLAAAIADGVAGKSIAIGSGELATIRQVVEHLVEITASTVQPHFGALADRPLEFARPMDIAVTQALIGWSPTTPLLEGLTRTVEWVQRGTVVGPQWPLLS